MGSRLSCVAGEMERLSLDLTQAAENKGIWDCLEFVYSLQVTSAKSRCVRGASHQLLYSFREVKCKQVFTTGT